MAQPKENSRAGTYIIILSIISGVNMLALIRGIIAVTYNPTPIQAATQLNNHMPKTHSQCRISRQVSVRNAVVQ